MSVLYKCFSVSLVLGLGLLLFAGSSASAVILGILLITLSISSLYLVEQRRRYYKGIDHGKKRSLRAA